MENVKFGSERPKGAKRSLLPPPGPNHYPTTFEASSPTHNVSDWMQFGNYTLCTSGEAAFRQSESGRSLVLSPWNRPHDKADTDERGYLGG